MYFMHTERHKNKTEWRRDIEILNALQAICEGNPSLTNWSLHKGSIMRSFDVPFVVGLNKLLNGNLKRLNVHVMSL